MVDQYVHLRQIGTPTGNPQTGGQLLYVKSDGYAYTKDSSGTEQKIGRAADITSAVAAHAALTTTHGVAGALVGTTDTQTLTNKTLTGPRVNQLLDTDGDVVIDTPANAGAAVNYIQVLNSVTGANPKIAVAGTDANRNLEIASKGVSQIIFTTNGLNYNSVNIVGPWQTFTPTVTAGSGTFTATSAAMRYLAIGKTVLFTCVINITTVGTASGSVNFTLPVTPASPPSGTVANIGWGRENAISGKMLQVVRGASAATIFNYDNTSPIAAGAALITSGTYEAA